MLSKEWTKWYLTDKGWIRGEQCFDSGKSGIKPDVPYYKIAIYKEKMSSPFDKIYEEFEEEIIDDKTSRILEAKFGQAPKSL